MSIEEEDATGFRLGSEAPRREPPFRPSIEPDAAVMDRIRKLQRRSTFLTVLALFLSAGMAMLFYVTLSRDLLGQSETVEKRLLEVSERQSRMEEAFGKTGAIVQESAEKTEKKFQDRLQELEAGVSEKVGKTDLEKALAGYRDEMRELSEALARQKERVPDLGELKAGLKKETDAVSARAYEAMEAVIKLQETLPPLEKQVQSAAAGNEALRTGLEKLQKEREDSREAVRSIQTLGKELTGGMEKLRWTLSEIKKRVDASESRMGQLEKRMDAYGTDLIRMQMHIKLLQSVEPQGGGGERRPGGRIGEQTLP